MKKFLKKNYSKLIIYLIIIIFSTIMIFPVIWSFSQSLKIIGLFFEYPFRFIPHPVAWENYPGAWHVGIGHWLNNSLFITIISVIISTFFATLTGYVFAKFNFRFKNIYFVVILATMMIPWHLIIIPLYEMVVKTKLVNTYTGLIIPFTLSAFGIFLMRQFITIIPDELIDAARVDGASEIRIFLQLIIPLSLPAMATLAIFNFMGTWEEFFWPLVAGNADRVKVVSVGMAGFVTAKIIDYNYQIAGAVISVLPVLILFIFLQRFITKGFMLSGIKG